MTLIQWTNALSTGIKRIDDQHKRFIVLINKSNDLVEAKNNKALIKELPILLDYARTHFSTEEEIFDKYSYPYSNEHKIAHLKLLEKAISFYDKAEKGEAIGKEFMVFLKDWLVNHLKKHDFKYSKYFQENKIKVE
jgi:hemerythrin